MMTLLHKFCGSCILHDMAATFTIVPACSSLHLQHMVTAEALSYAELLFLV